MVKWEYISMVDLDWTIILVFIHVNAFRVEKVEESVHRTLFTSWNYFGKLGFESFWECFEASKTFFGVKIYEFKVQPFFIITHTQGFPIVQ